MRLEAAVQVLLERLSDTQVEVLAAAASAHERPPAAFPGVVAGASPGAQQAVRDVLAAWRAAPQLTGCGLALALRLGSGLRQEAAERRSTPVWTGPGAAGDRRLTSGTIHALISAARERILLTSYSTGVVPQVAADLRDAIKRGCTVDVVFETGEDDPSYTGPSVPLADVEGLRRWRWPKKDRPPNAKLHAKLLVVDGRRALIGSANLSRLGHHKSLEAGVLIRDETVAAELEAHVRGLMTRNELSRVDAVQ